MKKILFVCLGNICRSPAAQGIFLKLLEQENLKGKFQVDSAGLLDYHEGESYDPRMIAHASKRGYNLIGTSRPITHEDFENYDLILAMDDEIFNQLKYFDGHNKYSHKIFMMIDFYSKNDFNEVPDPYYSNKEGFETVLNILEDACKGLLKKLKDEHDK